MKTFLYSFLPVYVVIYNNKSMKRSKRGKFFSQARSRSEHWMEQQHTKQNTTKNPGRQAGTKSLFSLLFFCFFLSSVCFLLLLIVVVVVCFALSTSPLTQFKCKKKKKKIKYENCTSYYCCVVQHEISLNSAVMSMMSHHTKSKSRDYGISCKLRMKMLAADERFVLILVPLAQIHFCNLLAGADSISAWAATAASSKKKSNNIVCFFFGDGKVSAQAITHFMCRLCLGSCMCVCVYQDFCNQFHYVGCWLSRLFFILLLLQYWVCVWNCGTRTYTMMIMSAMGYWKWVIYALCWILYMLHVEWMGWIDDDDD